MVTARDRLAPARAAVIDAGTNTILLLVGERDPARAGGVRLLADEIEFARLGEGVDRSRRLSAAAIERGLAAFRRFSGIARAHGVERVRATGTSALRDAGNARAFVDAVREETGIDLEVIDGGREARLGFAAATDDLPEGEPALVLDIGGGSVQLMRGAARRGPDEARSFDVGVVRMTERWLRTDPPTAEERARLEAEVDAALAQAPDADRSAELVGVAGTCTTLAAVRLGLADYDGEKVHGTRLTLAEIEALDARFLALDRAGRARVPGLHPKRADVILAGTAILRRVLARYRIESLRVADRGIRHALLRETLFAT